SYGLNTLSHCCLHSFPNPDRRQELDAFENFGNAGLRLFESFFQHCHSLLNLREIEIAFYHELDKLEKNGALMRILSFEMTEAVRGKRFDLIDQQVALIVF